MNRTGNALSAIRKFLSAVSKVRTSPFPIGYFFQPVALICFFLMLSRGVQAESPSIGIYGTLKYEKFWTDDSVYLEQKDDFHFVVADCKWYIKQVPKESLKFGKKGKNPPPEYKLALTDGTNFFEAVRFEKSATQNGRIGSGSVPYGLSDAKLIVLWYAFGSGCYLVRQQECIVPPHVFGQEFYTNDFRVRAYWSLTTNVSHLPTYIAFDGFKVNAGIQWGFTNAVYTASGFTNVGDMSLPSFAAIDYYVQNPTNDSLLRRVARMQIDVSRCELLTNTTVDLFQAPKLSESGVISDLRPISTNTPFGVAHYKDRAWPSKEASETKAKAIAENLRLQNFRSQENTRTALLIARGLIVILFVIAATILAKGLVKKRSKKGISAKI